MSTKIALQMYTLRDYTKTAQDFAQTIERVHKIGYEAVQLSAVGAMDGKTPQVSATEARKILDSNGIRCVATHRSWESLANQTAFEIEFHHALGCDFCAIGGMPGEYNAMGESGYQKFLDDSAPVIEKLNAAGIRFGYHNHAHEFQRYENHHKTFYDTFIHAANRNFLLEIDVYWAAHAGVNPPRLFEQLKGRVPLIHAKDKEVIKEGPVMAPVGEGNLDWDGILKACKAAKVEWYAVEQDTCRRDPFDCIRSSYQFLKERGL